MTTTPSMVITWHHDDPSYTACTECGERLATTDDAVETYGVIEFRDSMLIDRLHVFADDDIALCDHCLPLRRVAS